MLRTISRLRAYIEGHERRPHKYIQGRFAKYEIPDYMSDGFALLMEDLDLCAISDGAEGSSSREVASEDLGVS
jgi:hypothetical protein